MGEKTKAECGINEVFLNSDCIRCSDSDAAQDNICVNCQNAGTIITVDEFGKRRCQACLANEIIKNGECVSCPDGQVITPGTIPAKCATCELNSIATGIGCVKCQDFEVVESNQCVKCDASSVVTLDAAKRICSSCSDQEIKIDDFTCGLCEHNEVLTKTASGSVCVPCQQDEIKADEQTCEKCAADEIVVTDTVTSKRSCQKCGANQVVQQNQCTDCNLENGKIIRVGRGFIDFSGFYRGASSIECEYCEYPKAIKNGECVQCINTEIVVEHQCSPCESNQVASYSKRDCECPFGYPPKGNGLFI